MLPIGEYVAIEFSSADASTAATITVKNSDGTTRSLATYERLMIERLTISAVSDAGLVTLFNDSNADGNVAANERIVEWSDAVSSFSGGPEGYQCPVGLIPKVKAASSGQVSITGVGAVTKGKSEGVRPTWQASQISAGA